MEGTGGWIEDGRHEDVFAEAFVYLGLSFVVLRDRYNPMIDESNPNSHSKLSLNFPEREDQIPRGPL